MKRVHLTLVPTLSALGLGKLASVSVSRWVFLGHSWDPRLLRGCFMLKRQSRGDCLPATLTTWPFIDRVCCPELAMATSHRSRGQNPESGLLLGTGRRKASGEPRENSQE